MEIFSCLTKLEQTVRIGFNLGTFNKGRIDMSMFSLKLGRKRDCMSGHDDLIGQTSYDGLIYYLNFHRNNMKRNNYKKL